jgi:hypothetical protein
MATLGPAEAWSKAQRLSARARGDRRPSSVPLLVFGLLILASAPLMNDPLSLWRLAFWVIAGPVGFLLVAWWYRRRRLRAGVGSGRGSYARMALLVLASFLLALPLWVVPLPAVAAGLAILGVRQRNAYLTVCAAGLGVAGGLEAFGVFDNMLYRAAFGVGLFRPHYGYFDGAPGIVFGLIGMLMLGAGTFALWRERRSGHG